MADLCAKGGPDLAVPLTVSERDIDRTVGELADRFGWRAFHCGYPVRPIGRGEFVPEPRAKGFPDWLLLRGARMVVIECKAKGRRPRPEQEAWLDAFEEFAQRVARAQPWPPPNAVRVDVLVVGPSDLDSLAGVLR